MQAVRKRILGIILLVIASTFALSVVAESASASNGVLLQIQNLQNQITSITAQVQNITTRLTHLEHPGGGGRISGGATLLFNNETVNVIQPGFAGETFDNLETYTLSANNYAQILVEVNINVTGSTAIGQTTDIAFLLWYGSTQVDSYTIVQGSLNPAPTNGFFLTWSQKQTSQALIKVNATTITKFGLGSVENFRVWGIG